MTECTFPLMSRPIRLGGLIAVMMAMTIARPAEGSLVDLDLPDVDRRLLSEWVGYSPPEFTDSLRWHGLESHDVSGADGKTSPKIWQFSERTVVIQTFSHADDMSVRRLLDVVKEIDSYSYLDVQVIALHVPAGAKEFDAGKAKALLEHLPERSLIAVDTDGKYSDQLGVYTHPANLTINRDGVVTHIGLTAHGAGSIVDRLVNQTTTVHVAPANLHASFPSVTGDVRGANDLRGKDVPPLRVGEWLTEEPNCEGKLMIIKFWGTHCPHCFRVMPHLAELASQHPDDLCVIGVSSENRDRFDAGLRRRSMSINEVGYPLALRAGSELANVLQVRAVPHAVVVCSEGIVRWQGHPGGLTELMVTRMVRANKGASEPLPRNRWQLKLAESAEQ